MQKFGIDISRWQKGFNLSNAKKSDGIEFVIIKAGGSDSGRYRDSQFDTFYKDAKAAGLGVGAYYFGADLTVEDAKKSAEHFVTLLAGKQFDYPVYYDVEAKMLSLNKAKLSEIVNTFCSIVEKSGFFTGIYASSSSFANKMDASVGRYTLWIANWGKTKPSSKTGATAMWQFGGETNKIRSNKINGTVVDQDYCYVDFPGSIKKLGLNGYAKNTASASIPEPTPAPKTKKYKVKTPIGLNIRISPDKKSKKIGTMPNNYIFEVEEIKDTKTAKENLWGYIPKAKGWACINYAQQV